MRDNRIDNTSRGTKFSRKSAAGASSTATLTAEDMAQLKVSPGDTLSMTKAPDGAYRLTRCDDAVARQLPLAERIMHEDREVLRKLA